MTSPNTTPIIALTESSLDAYIAQASDSMKGWATHHQFTAKPGSALSIPGSNGAIECILAGVEETPNIWSLAHVETIAPAGDYHIQADQWPTQTLQEMALGLLLEQYRFNRYKQQEAPNINLTLPDGTNHDEIQSLCDSINFTRDLVNTPTNDMQPHHLAETAKALAERTGASFNEIVGDDLLKQNFPTIHAVGRASDSAPRLIELRHGDEKHPHITIVGKGVCFDTGGLDLKPYSSMKLMKKDMGGAALILGLAQMLMAAKLPIHLRVLIPAVENSVSSNAFRPQDIIKTRKGLTVEIGSTDAEGRLILCDALAYACEEPTELIIDAATLTGAARVALGTDLPALFSNDDSLAQTLQQTSHEQHDPLWQLPLWEGYAPYIEGSIADITNSANYRFAGATTAALFLNHFVTPDIPWLHIDTYAWNDTNRPGRPAGGDALGLRSIYHYLKKRYGGAN